MHDEPYAKLSRREREMMDVIYAVRATLRVLEEKGQLRHEHDGATYFFMATTPKDTASKSALRRSLSRRRVASDRSLAAGRVIEDRFTIEIPKSQPRGRLVLWTGWYGAAGRLPAETDALTDGAQRVAGPVIHIR